MKSKSKNQMELPVLDRITADPGGGYKVGQTFFANDSRLLETYYSEPVTNYVVGWMETANLEDELNVWAPRVETNRRFEYKVGTNAEEFLSETFDDQRAIGADFKRVRYHGTDVTGKTINKGLTYIADLDDEREGWENITAQRLTSRLFRNEVRRAVSVHNAAAVNTPKTWDKAAGNDPDMDVKSELLTATNLTGLRPNRVVFGDQAWLYREQTHRAQNNAGGYASAQMTPEQLAASLMVDRVLVSKSRYQDTATTKAEILGSAVYAFYADESPSRMDGSNVKRFVSPVEGGGPMRVYVQQISSKLVALTVEHYSLISAAFATGIRKLTITGV